MIRGDPKVTVEPCMVNHPEVKIEPDSNLKGYRVVSENSNLLI